jgi:hypothetical protein
MRELTVRHFTEDDIPIRSELLREARFQANLTDFAILTGDDALAAGQRRTIAEEHDTKRIFTVCARGDKVVGFLWITSIDWLSQVCELSFAMLPRYRGGYGPPAIDAVLGYLHDELNMEVVVNQVLEHNQMLHSAGDLAARGRVICPYDSYTVGQWRTAYYWTRGRAEFRADLAEVSRKRRERADRIRAAIREEAK